MSVFVLGGSMKTDNIYFATLSMVINREYVTTLTKINRTLPYKKILVEKKGKYTNDHYRDINTGISYKASKHELKPGGAFIDILSSFNYVTGNKNKNLSKEKVLKMYENVVRCNN